MFFFCTFLNKPQAVQCAIFLFPQLLCSNHERCLFLMLMLILFLPPPPPPQLGLLPPPGGGEPAVTPPHPGSLPRTEAPG